MIKYPLKTNIELISIYGDIFPCIITYAGKEILHVDDLYKRSHETDIFLQEKAYLDRDKFSGYAYPKKQEIIQKANNVINMRGKMKDEFTKLEEDLKKKFDLENDAIIERSDVFSKSKIPDDWTCDMYEFIFNAVGGVEHCSLNKKTRTANILFTNSDKKNIFLEKLNTNAKLYANEFLEKVKQVNPKKYIRNMTYSIEESDKSIKIGL